MNKNIIAMVVKHEYVFKLKEHKVEKCDLNLNNSLYIPVMENFQRKNIYIQR